MGMIIREVCPRCMSPQYKKNGHIHNGKQNHQCKDCGCQFVDCFEQYLISDETWALIERLLLERLSLHGICRAVGVGLKWLLGFIVTCFEALPDHLNVQPITANADVMIQRLEVEADEMASFVKKKASRYPRTNVRGTLSEVICLSSGIHPRVDTRGPLRTVDRPRSRRRPPWINIEYAKNDLKPKS